MISFSLVDYLWWGKGVFSLVYLSENLLVFKAQQFRLREGGVLTIKFGKVRLILLKDWIIIRFINFFRLLAIISCFFLLFGFGAAFFFFRIVYIFNDGVHVLKMLVISLVIVWGSISSCLLNLNVQTFNRIEIIGALILIFWLWDTECLMFWDWLFSQCRRSIFIIRCWSCHLWLILSSTLNPMVSKQKSTLFLGDI